MAQGKEPPLSFLGSRFISHAVKIENPVRRSFFAPKLKKRLLRRLPTRFIP